MLVYPLLQDFNKFSLVLYLLSLNPSFEWIDDAASHSYLILFFPVSLADLITQEQKICFLPFTSLHSCFDTLCVAIDYYRNMEEIYS